jgi:hypothetical protein
MERNNGRMGEGEFDAALARQHDAGIAWAKARLLADQLEEMTKPVLASIQNKLDEEAKGDHSEAKLKRLAEGSEEYKTHIRGMCAAKATANEARVEYDAAIAWFESRRSESALVRAKIEKGIFERGA